MNTFLPYADFAASAKVLDRQRLGKQRVEALQILRALHGLTKGWWNHPAISMWDGYEQALCQYGFHVCDEWLSRGYRDACRAEMLELACRSGALVMPPWFGDPALHASHRSNLLRKNFKWYSQFGWSEPPDLPYVWPRTQQSSSA